MDVLPLLKKLVEVHAPSGFEDAIRPLIIDELRNNVDEISIDSLGNVIAKKCGKNTQGPKVMLCAHMDEVGFIVKYINDEGFVFFEKYGMIDDRILLAQRVKIHTKKGPVCGVIGVKAKHLLTPEESARPLLFRDMWIDVGAQSRGEAGELGVRCGDPVTFDRDLQVIGKGNFVTGRALDNRLGLTVLIQVMRELLNEEHEATVYAVASVMEEVGARGAQTAAAAINPNIAVALDVTHGTDPAVTPMWSAIKLGGGPSIRLADIHWPTLQGCLTPTWLKELVLQVANEAQVPYQVDVLSGTFLDSSTIHTVGRGVPSLGILIPRRNGHTPAEVACLDDVKNAVRLVVAFIRRLTRGGITEFPMKIK
ncbi:MAG: M42 family metallopeptidase [Candidatus Jordarchaeaceae archaeon]